MKDDGSSPRGPDPSEFENAFVIEDEGEVVETASETAIEAEKTEKMGDNPAETGVGSEKGGEEVASPSKPAELPAEVRTKLRKLEKLESKYQGKVEWEFGSTWLTRL